MAYYSQDWIGICNKNPRNLKELGTFLCESVQI